MQVLHTQEMPQVGLRHLEGAALADGAGGVRGHPAWGTGTSTGRTTTPTAPRAGAGVRAGAGGRAGAAVGAVHHVQAVEQLPPARARRGHGARRGGGLGARLPRSVPGALPHQHALHRARRAALAGLLVRRRPDPRHRARPRAAVRDLGRPREPGAHGRQPGRRAAQHRRGQLQRPAALRPAVVRRGAAGRAADRAPPLPGPAGARRHGARERHGCDRLQPLRPPVVLELDSPRAKSVQSLLAHPVNHRHRRAPRPHPGPGGSCAGPPSAAIIVIPKSNHVERRQQNLDCCSFDLAADEIDAISALDRGLRFNDPGTLARPIRIFG